MARRRLWGVPTAQGRELWARWKAGESMAEIARALSRTAPAIAFVVAREGGIVRPPRQRARRALTLEERETITRGVAAGSSIQTIAQTLTRAPSTISREIRRNGGRTLYRAARADAHARREPMPTRGAAANCGLARDRISGRSDDARLA